METVQVIPVRSGRPGLCQQHNDPAIAPIVRMDTGACTSIDANARLDLGEPIGKRWQSCGSENPKTRHTRSTTSEETE
jgi:hypothetical protein